MLEKIEHLNKLFSFSWAQSFSDQNGKSSILSVSGFIIVVSGCLGFLYSGVTKDANLTTQSVLMTSIGAGILMGRKIVNGKPGELPFMDNDSKPNQP